MVLPNVADGLDGNGNPLGTAAAPSAEEIAGARDILERATRDGAGGASGNGPSVPAAVDAGGGGGPIERLDGVSYGGPIRRLDGSPAIGRLDGLVPVVTSAPTPPTIPAAPGAEPVGGVAATPESHFITPLSGAPPAAGGGTAASNLPAEGTTAFYQGVYTPGKGVADADGYYDPAFHSTANIVNNAKQGDPAALAKLAVIARVDPAARAILDDLGPRFGEGQQHAEWLVGHNSQVNNELAQGLDAGNVAARTNLASQREVPPATVLPLKEADPPAYEMMNALGDMGATKITYTPQDGISFVTDGVKRNVPIGEIVTTLPKVKELFAAHAPPAA